MKHTIALSFILGLVITACTKTSEDRYQQAVTDYDAKKYDAAIAQLDTVLQQDNTFVNAYIVRGNSKLNLKDFDGAIEDYTKSLALVDSANNKADILSSRGSAYFELGNFDQAKEDFLSATVQNPDYAEAYYLLALS